MRASNKPKAKAIVVILIAVAVVAVIVGLLFFLYEKKVKEGQDSTVASQTDATDYHTLTVDGKTYTYNTSLIGVLYMGVDTTLPFDEYAKENSNSGSNGRADSVSLVLFDRANKRIKILAISRDSMIDIKVTDAGGKFVGWKKDHLALAYSYGNGKEKSCQLVTDAVSNLFNNIPIIYYTASNLTTLSDMVSLVDGVEVVVPNNDLVEYGQEYQKGNTLLIDGNNAERFLRTRDINVAQSNTGRMERQQVFLSSYVDKLKIKLNSDLAGIVKKTVSIMDNVVTNISVNEVGDLAQMTLDYTFDPSQDYYQLEGEQIQGDAHDEFYLDEDALQRMILKIFYKEAS